jgi:hypothetical protein
MDPRVVAGEARLVGEIGGHTLWVRRLRQTRHRALERQLGKRRTTGQQVALVRR